MLPLLVATMLLMTCIPAAPHHQSSPVTYLGNRVVQIIVDHHGLQPMIVYFRGDAGQPLTHGIRLRFRSSTGQIERIAYAVLNYGDHRAFTVWMIYRDGTTRSIAVSPTAEILSDRFDPLSLKGSWGQIKQLIRQD